MNGSFLHIINIGYIDIEQP